MHALSALPLMFVFFFFFFGGRAIHYMYVYTQRKKPQVSSEKPPTAEAASYLTTWAMADNCNACGASTCQAKQAA